MGRLLLNALVIVGVVWGGLVPAGAVPLVTPGVTSQIWRPCRSKTPATGVASTGATAIADPISITLLRMATTCLRPHTLPSMAMCLPTRMAAIHHRMVVSTATIRPRMGMRATTLPRAATKKPIADVDFAGEHVCSWNCGAVFDCAFESSEHTAVTGTSEDAYARARV